MLNANNQDNISSTFYLASEEQLLIEQKRCIYFENSYGTLSDKLNSLSRYMSRQNMAKLLCYYELMRMTTNIPGSIVEGGVFFGNGLMNYALLAVALEPYNFQCKIIGFDTFCGDTDPDEVDKLGYAGSGKNFIAESRKDLLAAIDIFDKDRPLNHIKKVFLIEGDIQDTAVLYARDHPELLIRILHLSFNLLNPTQKALETFLPLVPKGGVVVIHGLNFTPGATQALKNIGLSNKELRTFPFYSNITYFVV